MKKILKVFAAIAFAFLAVTVPVYWFNLDTKLVKLLEKTMMKHYDSMKRRDPMTRPYGEKPTNE